MGNIFYIADTHFGHGNVIRFDRRPFKTVEDMDKELMKRWNKTVSDSDTVYILGDFIWKDINKWREIPNQLNGKKILIKGNHDLKEFPADIRKLFYEIRDYKEITDDGRKVVLSHYPMPFYRADYKENMYHLYGHIHITEEHRMLEEFRKYILEDDKRDSGRSMCQFYNLWCGFYDYKPVTLDQVIEYWKENLE